MARANVGTLSVIVGANIRALNRGLARGAQSVGRFAKSVGRTARRVAAFGIAAAGAAAVIGGIMVRGQLRAIDQTAKLSQQLSASTENLTALQHQAGLTGSSSEALASSLQRMNRRIGLAAQGTGEAADALERMGLDAQAMTDMGADEQFRQIAQRISEVDDAGEQAALAFRVFGRQGQELLPMLRQGAAGMDAARKETERFGTSLTEAEASRIEDVNDAMTRLRAVLTGVARRLTIAVAPALIKGIQFVRVFAERGQAIFSQFLNNVIRPVFSGIREIISSTWRDVAVTAIMQVQRMWGVTRAVFEQLWSLVSSVFPSINQSAVSNITGAVKAFTWFRQSIGKAFGVVEFTIRNWQDVFALGIQRANLTIVRFANQTHHFFTEVIPSAVEWFARNWRNLLRDALDALSTFASNVGTNLSNLWSAITGFLRGEGFDFEWTGLMEGFRSSVTELPKIAAREIGPLENQLASNVAGLESKVGGALDEFLRNRREQAEQTADSLAEMFSVLGMDIKIGGIDTETAQALGRDVGDGFSETAQTKQAEPLDLIRAGTAQAQALAQRMTRGMQRDRVGRDQLREQKATAKGVAELVRQGARQTDPMVVSIPG